MADLKRQTNRGDANRELQQGAQAGSSTPPAPRLASYCSSLESRSHLQGNYQKGQRAEAKRPDSGTQRSAKVQGNARSELESKEYIFFSSFDKDTEFWGQGLGSCVPEELIFTRAITRGDASNSA